MVESAKTRAHMRFARNLAENYPEVYIGITALKKRYSIEEYVVNCYICRNKKTGDIAYFDAKMSPFDKLYFYKIG
jgi:hypothetical protein